MASKESHKLRVFFLPFSATAGHMFPMVDAAILFARHGVDATVVTTNGNVPIFQNAIGRESRGGYQIRIHSLPFPSAEAGAPVGIENLPNAPSLEAGAAVVRGFWLLQEPLEKLFRDARPDCLVTDAFFPWTADLAAELGIPRLVFQASCYFERCADHSLKHYQPHKSTESDIVLLPGLPHKIELLRSQLPDWTKKTNDFTRLLDSIRKSMLKSYGAVVNSFRELESPYEDYFVNTLGIKAWSIGPLFLWLNQDNDSDKAERYDFAGGEKEKEKHEVMKWLSSKEENSVLYVGFGSLTRLDKTQLFELACGLEACGRPFVWVAQKKDSDESWEGFPEGFEQRMEESERGFVIRGWAPQRLILNHPAVGSMVTHCGWNSIMEGLTAGLPMITWPLFAEQFFNEKLVTELLGIGVAVGVKEWTLNIMDQERKEVVKGEQIEKAVALLMGRGEEAAEMKKRVRKLANLAKKAVESGGSSQANLIALINELKSLKIKSTSAGN